LKVQSDRKRLCIELDLNDSAYLSYILRVGMECVEQLKLPKQVLESPDPDKHNLVDIVLANAYKIAADLTEAIDRWRHSHDPIYSRDPSDSTPSFSTLSSSLWTSDGDHYVTCPLCLGTGKIVRTARTTSKGEILYEFAVCPECLGKGFVKVRIQVGSSNGASE